jgi:hypothetical protein
MIVRQRTGNGFGGGSDLGGARSRLGGTKQPTQHNC